MAGEETVEAQARALGYDLIEHPDDGQQPSMHGFYFWHPDDRGAPAIIFPTAEEAWAAALEHHRTPKGQRP